MKNIITGILFLLGVGYLLSNPDIQSFILKMIKKDVPITESYTVLPPTYDLGVISEILETAVLSQTISITFDTILPVKKTFNNALVDALGYKKPWWRTNTSARMYYQYNYVVKCGYKIEDNDILKIDVFQIEDTIIITLPPPRILTIELSKTIDKLQDDNSNDKLVINRKFITETQRNRVYNYTKFLAKQKLVSTQILSKTDEIGKEKIRNFLQSINPNYVIIVRSYGDKF